jgi:peptidoglycan/LPS O-acetylase OafA/YrhL
MGARMKWFPGLNGLRFFAAMAVAVSHVELLKQYNGLPNIADRPVVYELGRLAVTLFFVLSGFLITYLLLEEKRETKTIAVRQFYIRRMLRIWPLYFLLIGLSFFVFPHIGILRLPGHADMNLEWTLPLFLFFLPQLALSIFEPVPFAEPAWSIGVEEQFYLLWPLLMRRFRSFVKLAVVVIVVTLAARYGALWMAQANRANGEALQLWNYAINYFYFTRMECMAIGGLFAWAAFEKKFLDVLHSRITQVLVYALTVYLLVTDAHKPIFSYGWYAVCFGVLIFNVATNPKSLLRFPATPFDFLGNISFSIYMVHEVVIQLVLRTFGVDALYPVSLTLTLLVASASYLWFERPFLRLKSRYAVIATNRERLPPAVSPSFPPVARSAGRSR